MERRDCAFGYFEIERPNIFKFKITKLEPTMEDLEEYNQMNHELFATFTEPFVVIFDATDSKWLSSEARIKMGKDGKELEDKYLHIVKRAYLVIPNPIMKMMVQGINLVHKPKIPQDITKTVEEAYELARKEVASW